MTKRIFRALYRRADEYVIASTPDMPGAFGQGKSIDEAREDLVAAIQLMLEAEADDYAQAAREAILEESLEVAIA
ncbi:MAG TPA: type II toxin-antitoxin system HicB family antitoxin [Burkholderiales bacterium]|nr:type II toxin-antitoxin system HicB family antitoxin [Burkholderiales bacterium]